jgi:protease-4
MAKFLIGLATGAMLVFGTFILLFLLLLRFREQPPVVASDTVLVIHLSGEIPEKPPIDLPVFLGGSQGISIPSIWMGLKKAAADPHIRAVVVEPSGLSIGWAKLEEIRRDLVQFRASGKPVFAYLRSPNARDYYVALAADRIYLGPQETLMLKGIRAEAIYFKKTLDKLGINVYVEHAGKYKDFGDMFTRSGMSPETREVVSSIVDAIYGNLVSRIAEARKKSADEVRAIIDRGPFTARDALEAGLVDELRFEDQAWRELRDRLQVKGEPAEMTLARYSKVPPERAGLRVKSRIALVVGEGEIVRGDPSDSGFEESSLTAYGFNRMLRQVERDSTIKGVIVRIDSPGGEVAASDEIWRQMNLLSKKKPMIISMSDLAASGGYYLSMTGDPIVAEPATETGSIGVIFGKPDLRGLYAKLGISKDSVEQGKHAGIDSDYTSLTPDEQALLRRGIDQTYRDFLEKVAAARRKPLQQIEPVAQGRVWLGQQALPRGLVDELGGLDAAVSQLKRKAKIPADEEVEVVLYPRHRSLWDILFRRSREDALESKLSSVFGSSRAGAVPFHAWMKGGYLMILPYRVIVQ